MDRLEKKVGGIDAKVRVNTVSTKSLALFGPVWFCEMKKWAISSVGRAGDSRWEPALETAQ